MRTLLSVLAVLLVAALAFAQIPGATLPDNAKFGAIEIGVAATDSLCYGSDTINGVITRPDGLVMWATGPFRYKARFPWGTDTAISVSVDTALADMRGDVKYSVYAVVPGAIWATVSAITGSDTVFARPYYLMK